MSQLYVATKLDLYTALVSGVRVSRVAVHGVPVTSEEIETGEDLGGRSEVRIDTALAADLWADEDGNDWATLGDCDVLLLDGFAEIIRGRSTDREIALLELAEEAQKHGLGY